jgi:hypothetical protein
VSWCAASALACADASDWAIGIVISCSSQSSMTVAPGLADDVCTIVHRDVIAAAIPCTGSDTISIHSMTIRTMERMEINLTHAKMTCSHDTAPQQSKMTYGIAGTFAYARIGP